MRLGCLRLLTGSQPIESSSQLGVIRDVSQKTNAYYTQNQESGDIWGSRLVTRFQGIQVVMCEKILNTEPTVTATT